MPLQKRKLRVTFSLPSGDVVFDETTEMNITVSKDCLHSRPTAQIEIFNLTTGLREQLLTTFSEWNLRMIQTGVKDKSTGQYTKVKIEAGYIGKNGESTGLVFTGEVVTTSLTSTPPNIGISISCASRMIDRTKDNTYPPPGMTFIEYVNWAAKQMGVTTVNCETSYDNQQVKGMFDSVHDISSLMWAIQSVYRPHVVAYVDNDVLTVRDINRPLVAEGIIPVDEFIGVPTMASFGASYQTLFDQKIHLGGIVTLNSKMNPSLGTAVQNTKWLVFKLQYTLSSRNTPFYLKADVYPAAV
jgi:hypothetical protein